MNTEFDSSVTALSMPGSPPSSSDDVSQALADACAQVQRIISRNDARDALDRYHIGCIIRDVRNAEHKYGQGSVGKIARAVGRDVDTLYEYANVAETWSEIEIVRLLERRTPCGVPLSFSHLVFLSRLRRQRDLLKALTDRALTGISARHLRALVEEALRGGRRHESSAPAPLVELNKLVRSCNRIAESSLQLDETLAALQASAPGPELVTVLQRAIDASRTLQEVGERNAARLHEEYRRVCAELDESGAEPPRADS